MIDRFALLADLKPLVTALEADLRGVVEESAKTTEHLVREHAEAVTAERTAMSYEEWLGGEVTQAAVAWVLACVFVRFLEDNALIDEPLISGPGPRRAAALGRREVYFAERPADSDREYLDWCFAQVARFPAVAPLYDPRHTPLQRLRVSVDGAAQLRELWTRQRPETGELVHDFTDPKLGTRFLGDLYKDTGLRTRAEWEHVWDLQRQEDAIDVLGLPPDEAARRKVEEVSEIPVPPKYKLADFRKTDYWRLRGKLDVP